MKKSDERVDADGYGLTQAQQTVLAALVNGSSVSEAAQIGGVSRQCASRWRNQDPHFIACLNATLRDGIRDTHRQLLSLTLKVISVLAEDLAAGGEPARRTARDLARLLTRLTPERAGPTDPDVVQSELTWEWVNALGPDLTGTRSDDCSDA